MTAMSEPKPEYEVGEFTEAQLTAMLFGAWKLRLAAKDAASAYEKVKEPFRAWLKTHPGDFLRDGESRCFAKLQERNGSLEADTITMAEKEPELLVRLAALGCLKLDAKAFEKGVQGKRTEGEQAKAYLMEGPGSVALIIDQERE